MFDAGEIQRLVEKGIPGAQAEVRDTTGTADHFELRVISTAFEGKNLVARHRMIYAAIGPAVGGEIHALSIQAKTPNEVKP